MPDTPVKRSPEDGEQQHKRSREEDPSDVQPAAKAAAAKDPATAKEAVDRSKVVCSVLDDCHIASYRPWPLISCIGCVCVPVTSVNLFICTPPMTCAHI